MPKNYKYEEFVLRGNEAGNYLLLHRFEILLLALVRKKEYCSCGSLIVCYLLLMRRVQSAVNNRVGTNHEYTISLYFAELVPI